MKKILLVLLLFLPVFILTAQQKNNSGEFAVEIWQVNQRQAAVITKYNGSSAHIVIPGQINGYPVAGIGNNAFRSRRIESVQFPQTLVFVGEYAFYDNRLSDIKLPSSVTTVGAGAFDNNVPGNNPPRSSSTAPAAYTRTVTIQPAHSSSTVYAPPKPAASQAVNIMVVPGYNPLDSVRQSSPLSVTAVWDYRPSTAPASSGPAPVPQQTAAPRPQPAAAPQDTPYKFVIELENQNPTGEVRNKQFQLVPQGTAEMQGNTIIDTKVPELQLHQQRMQRVWQQPRRR
ncbi:MAG: leucine-rich repeat domain-containing protein [Spirochaetaceae bacterium]|jgi:hypothetical protein|nr:leucine-rich repeat domain-containing protein [Spirochaetaceae bacterium]